jgi:hypothetical protein
MFRICEKADDANKKQHKKEKIFTSKELVLYKALHFTFYRQGFDLRNGNFENRIKQWIIQNI